MGVDIRANKTEGESKEMGRGADGEDFIPKRLVTTTPALNPFATSEHEESQSSISMNPIHRRACEKI